MKVRPLTATAAVGDEGGHVFSGRESSQRGLTDVGGELAACGRAHWHHEEGSVQWRKSCAPLIRRA